MALYRYDTIKGAHLVPAYRYNSTKGAHLVSAYKYNAIVSTVFLVLVLDKGAAVMAQPSVSFKPTAM